MIGGGRVDRTTLLVAPRRVAHSSSPGEIPRMTERRYTETEVAEILERATNAGDVPAHRGSGAGLSLVELQAIGTEVGISADRIDVAARSLDTAPSARTTRMLGMPLGVQDGVALSRRLTDEEWDLMVVAARETFAARGTLHSDGDFREWTNGHLAMMLEPSADGQQLRFQTRNGVAESMLYMGFGFGSFGMALLAGGAFVSGPKAAKLIAMGSIFLGMGAIAAVAGAARLPSWARRRREQMQRLSRRAIAMIAATR